MLIDLERREVEIRTRVNPRQWLSTFLQEGDITLDAAAISLPIAALWKDLEQLGTG